MRFSQVGTNKDISFDAVIKNISALLKENSAEKLFILNSSLSINAKILEIVGVEKFQCFFKNIELDSYRKFICTLKCFSKLQRKGILKSFKNVPLYSFMDFIFCINHYELSRFDDLSVIKNVILQIGCGQSIDNLLARSNSYVKLILSKKAFDQDAKVRAILNATKPIVNINCIKHNNSFLNVDVLGQATSCENDVSEEPPMLGLFYKDLQYIDNLATDVFIDGRLLSCKNYSSNYLEDESQEEMYYAQDVYLSRKNDIKDNFKQETLIKNNSSKRVKVLVKLNILGSDIFETRAKLRCKEKEISVKEENNHLIYSIKYPYLEPYTIDVSLEDEQGCVNPEKIDRTFIRYTVIVEPNESKKVNLRAIYKEEDIYEKTKDNVKVPIKDYSHLGSVQNKVVQKASMDLNKLISSVVINEEKLYYISAGIPRYASLFGRDSILSAYMIKDLQPNLVRDTIKILGYHQGKSFEERFKNELEFINNSSFPVYSKVSMLNGLRELYQKREEEEGKIIHELRLGPLTQITKTPHNPYYGSVDATPLWLMLASDYYLNTKDEKLYMEILPLVEKSIEWISNNLHKGYLRFSGSGSSRNVNIKNQGWKDADDSLKHLIGEDGMLKDPDYPVALAEVQAYIYKAFVLTACAFRSLGIKEKALELDAFASELKERFNKDFWCDNTSFYAIGIDANNNRIQSVTSNIGHCLFSEIVDDERKLAVENRLMGKDMFSGVGIRTLGFSSEAYDPLSYHNGSVWPHDSSICAMSMRRENKRKVFDGLCYAAYNLPNMTIPEVVAGHNYLKNTPIECYPDTCSPQGWSSAGIIGLALKLS